MIMADVFMVLFLIVGILIVLVAYWLLFEALFPTFVERARQTYEHRAFRAAGVGILAGLPLLVVGIAFASAAAAPVKIFGIGLLIAMLLAALMGSAGLARLIGARLPGGNDGRQPWLRVLRGGTVLSITFVLPIAGWFAVLPIALITGFGAMLLALRRSPADAPAPAVSHAGMADA